MADRKLVLVVETNYLIAGSVEGPLLAAGFDVVVAVDVVQARAAIGSVKLSIAIIDFRLQHGHPDGLVAQLQTAGIPYVFCTAASTVEVVENFPDARVIEKPFGDDVLLMIVDQVLESAAPAG